MMWHNAVRKRTGKPVRVVQNNQKKFVNLNDLNGLAVMAVESKCRVASYSRRVNPARTNGLGLARQVKHGRGRIRSYVAETPVNGGQLALGPLNIRRMS